MNQHIVAELRELWRLITREVPPILQEVMGAYRQPGSQAAVLDLRPQSETFYQLSDDLQDAYADHMDAAFETLFTDELHDYLTEIFCTKRTLKDGMISLTTL
ncbi:hypothetical protein HDU86_000535 [Geranomyces michiganensis]|nr:hypothetical protein HDU86_000535 [Geranomyces michiganensis]